MSDEAGHADWLDAHAALIADRLSEMLPDGYRFGYETGPVARISAEELAARTGVWSPVLAGRLSEWARADSPLSDAELDEFERRWRKAMEHPNRVRLLTPLPRRTRFRLWRERRIDHVASWLCGHRAGWAAVALWRLFGMWWRQ